jgi:hypothetical protein
MYLGGNSPLHWGTTAAVGWFLLHMLSKSPSLEMQDCHGRLPMKVKVPVCWGSWGKFQGRTIQVYVAGCTKNQPETVKILLDAGVDANSKGGQC